MLPVSSGPETHANMKSLAERPRWLRIIMVASVLFLVVALLFRKPLLIAYHRHEMVTIWQTELGISRPSESVGSVRKFLGLPVARNPNPQAAARAFSHREALLNLGYFTKKRFAIHPVTVGTAEYQKLCDMVSAESGQQPIAQFDYDQPAEPKRVLGLIVYATPSEMSQWEQFITPITGHPE